MRKIYLILCLVAGLHFGAAAQQCGYENDSIALTIPSGPDSIPNFMVSSDSLPCIVTSQQWIDTLYFTAYSKLSGFAIDSFTIDSINNLPTGLCWSTNSVDNTFGGGQNGVIYLSGIVWAYPGQYKLQIYVSATTAFFDIPVTSLESINGFRYYLKVICGGDVCAPVDSIGGLDSLFIPYNTQFCNAGIEQLSSNLSDMSVVPNPFSDQAEVSFRSAMAGNFSFEMTDLLGAVVYSRQVYVMQGDNEIAVDRNGLSPGIYFMSMSDGTSSLTRKAVIAY